MPDWPEDWFDRPDSPAGGHAQPLGIASGVAESAPFIRDNLNAEHIRRAERARVLAAVLALNTDGTFLVRAAVIAAIKGETT